MEFSFYTQQLPSLFVTFTATTLIGYELELPYAVSSTTTDMPVNEKTIILVSVCNRPILIKPQKTNVRRESISPCSKILIWTRSTCFVLSSKKQHKRMRAENCTLLFKALNLFLYNSIYITKFPSSRKRQFKFLLHVVDDRKGSCKALGGPW